MMNRIDTLSSQRLWTKPAIVIETELGDGFDNAPRRSSKVTASHPETNPDAPQRFSNLLSLLPYLEQSKPIATSGDPMPVDVAATQPVKNAEFKRNLTAKERLDQDLAQLLETRAETQT